MYVIGGHKSRSFAYGCARAVHQRVCVRAAVAFARITDRRVICVGFWPNCTS